MVGIWFASAAATVNSSTQIR